MNCLLTENTQIAVTYSFDKIWTQSSCLIADVTTGVCKELLGLSMQTEEASLGSWTLHHEKNSTNPNREKHKYIDSAILPLWEKIPGYKSLISLKSEKGHICPIRTFQQDWKKGDICLSITWFCFYCVTVSESTIIYFFHQLLSTKQTHTTKSFVPRVPYLSTKLYEATW